MAPRKPKTPAERLELERQAREMTESIERMSANGLSPQQITMLTGLKAERLYKKYKDALMRGGARRVNEVAESAFLMAVGGPDKNWRQADPSMARFWLERQGGPAWSAPQDSDPGPDLTRLTVPELIELERALRPLAKTPILIDAETRIASASVEIDATVARGGDSRTDEARAGAVAAGGDGDDRRDPGEVPGEPR